MPLELRLLTGLALALGVVYSATPIAIRVADRFRFYDRPVGYKAHGKPTPYLGGAAVICGFVIAVTLFAESSDRTVALLAGTIVMWAVGTWDDRLTVTPVVRVSIEVALAAGLWALGLGWSLGFGAGVDLAVTAVWTVAVVNAFNLFDNMDGATPSMGTVVAAGLCILGLAQGNTWLAVGGAALCGACLGFLPHNLSSPARIFLGDGGSMPIGFAVATLTMIGLSESAVEWQSLAMGLLFVGVPALDTSLVMISRRRRGISLMTAGRDHLTHRAHGRLRTARAVVVALGSAQATISVLAVFALRGGSSTVVAAVALYLVGAGVAIVVLDNRWAPAETPVAPPPGPTESAQRLRRRRLSIAALLVVPIAVALGAGLFADGYYGSDLWVPAGMAILAALTAAVVAAPPRLTRAAVLVLGGLVALAVWSLTSALWADSIEHAVRDANRLFVYAAFAGLLLSLLRTDEASVVLIGALAAAVSAGAAVVVVRMLGPDAADLFVAGRLNEPLGYINGEAAFFLLGVWCCVAVAEQKRSSWLAAAGAAGATLLACLLLLTQSRGVALATFASAAIVMALVPGRLRRAFLLAAIAAAVATAGPALLAVYDSGRDGGQPADVVQTAAWRAALAALGAGLAWGLLHAAGARNRGTVARLRPAAIGALAAAALAILVVGVVEREPIANAVERQYTSFTALGAAAGDSSSRLTSGAGNRYDYWRIAWGAFEDRPLLGVGAGNYDRPYFERRATEEDVTQPHSVQLQVLSELGVVGLALLVLIAVGVSWAALGLAGAARGDPTSRFLAVAAIGCVAAWAVQTSVDWLHLLPGVTGIALVGLAVLLRDRSVTPAIRTAAPARARRRRLALASAVAIALAIAGASLSRQGLAERFRADGQSALARDPAEALRQADRSLRLDPEAPEGYYLKAAAFARFDQAGAARAALLEAARREPGNFVTWALLGDLAVRSGDVAEARRNYRRALALNPRDPGLQAQARDVAP